MRGEGLGQRRQHLHRVADDAVVCVLKDGCIGIGVDSHDHVRTLATHPVLDGARDASGDVELGPHRLAGLPHLPLGIHPAGLHAGARRTNLAAKHTGQFKHQLEVLRVLQALAPADDDIGIRQVDLVAVGVCNEVQQLCDDLRLDHAQGVVGDLARAAGIRFGHQHDAGAHGGHLRAVGQRHDGAVQRAAKGRPCGGQRFGYRVDAQLGAISRQPGQQRGGHRARQIATHRGGPQQQNLGLVFVDQIRQALGKGLIAVALEHRVMHDIGFVGAECKSFRCELFQRFVDPAQNHHADRAAQRVGQLARFAHQLP